MKKLFVLIIAFMAVALPMRAVAETNSPSWATSLHVEASFSGSSPNKDILPLGTLLDINYGIKRFSLHAVMEGTYFLPKDNLTKNYNQTANLGGGVGFEIFPPDINDRSVFEARAYVSRSLGKSAYSHTTYKIGIHWLARTQRRSLSPIVGVGYCLRSFSNKDVHSYNGMYVSLGIRF